MKRNKRSLSLLLTSALALSLAVPALAVETDVLTRGKFIAALYERSGEKGVETHQEQFADVPADGMLAQAVRWAADAKVINGYGDGRFGPDDPVTREQMAAMFYRRAQALGQGFQGAWMFPLDYPDKDMVSGYADEAMHWVVMNRIITGTDKGLEPRAYATEEQLSLALLRWQEAVGESTSHVFRFEGRKTLVTLDLRGGWTADYGAGAVYLYDGENDGEKEAAAYGYVLEQWEYDENVAEYSGYDSFRAVENGVKFSEGEGGRNKYLFAFGNGRYYMIAARMDLDPESVYARFAVKDGGPDYLVLVNKHNPLPESWEGMLETVTVANSCGDEVTVEKNAWAAYERLKDDLAKNDGVYVDLDSAYRSVEKQQEIMDRFTREFGADYAAKTVAQPGYSEHHTGVALDLYLIVDGKNVVENADMEQYPELWEKIHAKLAAYGFILRYPEGREHVTGYGYEPWHIRFVGDAETAREISAQPGLTLEEYLSGERVPEVAVDYGVSGLYTEDELHEAVVQIKCQFASWTGCELHSLRYAGDGCTGAENVAWLNELDKGAHYVQAVEFLGDYHSPEFAYGAWEADTEYTDYQWWLAREKDGGWQLVSWGY